MALLNDKTRNFLKENLHLIQEGKIKEFYNKLEKTDIVTGVVTKILENSGIDPLKNLNIIPNYYHGFDEDLINVDIPKNIKIIGKGAFSWCKNLKEVNIPNSITVIGHAAFEGCEALEYIIIPDNVTDLEQAAFAYCVNLKNIKLSNNLTELQSNTFYLCNNLEVIHLPDNLEKIDNQAFNKCHNLKSIYLNNKIKYISEYFGDAAFSNKRDKLKIIYNGTIEEWNNIEVQNNSNIDALIQCKDGVIKKYIERY